MKFKLLSDLHLDIVSYKDTPDENSRDTVLVLAGDTCEIARMKYFRQFLSEVAPEYLATLVLFGNHEYYGSSISNAAQKFKSAVSELPRIHVMDKNSMRIDDITVIGATLWTDCNKEDPVAMFDIQRQLNDYHQIRIGTEADPYKFGFSTKHSVAIHRKELAFIKKSLEEAETDKRLVITHHAPSYQSVDEKYKGSPLNAGFVSDLEPFILENDITEWWHGHTHNSADYMVGKTRIRANPRGYGKENQHGFDPNLIIEI